MEEHSLLLEFCIPLSHYCAEMPFEIVIEPFGKLYYVSRFNPLLGLFWKKWVFFFLLCVLSLSYSPFSGFTDHLVLVHIGSGM